MAENVTMQEMKLMLGKAEIDKMKAIGEGLQVGKIWGNRLLIRPIQAYTDMDRAQKSGIYVPKHIRESNTPKPSTGVVAMIGEGVEPEDAAVFPPGTIVGFSKYGGTTFVFDDAEFTILDLNEVLCTIVDTKGVVVPVKEDGE